MNKKVIYLSAMLLATLSFSFAYPETAQAQVRVPRVRSYRLRNLAHTHVRVRPTTPTPAVSAASRAPLVTPEGALPTPNLTSEVTKQVTQKAREVTASKYSLEQRRAIIRQQEQLVQQISEGKIAAKYYVGKGQYFDPLGQSIARATQENNSILNLLIKLQKNPELIESMMGLSLDEAILCGFIDVEAYVLETAARMYQGETFTGKPLNEPLFPANNYSASFRQRMGFGL